jgi:hypothetical protein
MNHYQKYLPEYAITLLNGVYAGTAIVLGDFTLPEICTVTNLALFNLTKTSADASSNKFYQELIY